MTFASRVVTFTRELVWLLVFVLILPLAVLAVGIPAALLVRLALGLFRMA